MRTEIKNRLLLMFSILCLIALSGQTILLWQTNNRLAETIGGQDEIPASIEQRLLAELDKKDAANASRTPFSYGTPFGGSSQLQDYVDSIFSNFGMSPFSGSRLFPPNSMSSMTFSAAIPEIALDETGEEYRILIPVQPDQEVELNTNIEDSSISLAGTITEKSQQSRSNFSASSFSQRQFAKTLSLPSPVDEFGMTTTQTEAGIEITLPKKNS